ncbi:MAG: DUF1501 domain-containing protein [Planctomycetota bacterium]
MTNALSRREWLAASGGGFGSIALAAMHPACVRQSKVKRVVQLFMAGAASHLDLFDYKPSLAQHHGKPSDFGEPVEAFQNGLGPWLKPIWAFKPYGQSGKMLSDVVAPLGDVVDRIAFIHNMVSPSGVHSAATLHQTTGFVLPGFPGAGCWVSYALGSENDNLPTYVVLPDHRGYGSNGVKNWDAGFLPAQYSGTVIQPASDEPIADLRPHKAGSFVTPAADKAARATLERLNRRHLQARPGDARLEGRIESYELAARMQLAAPEALGLDGEPEHVLRLYGIDRAKPAWPGQINAEEEAHHFGLRCLTARRLLERGVRFVQVWSGNDNGFPRRNWDSHEDLERDHGPLARGMSRGAAALIKDLEQRGMLDDTLVLWTTEFGRMPSSQNGGKGRDHNPFVFTNWLCGGGIKEGVTCGESDQWGYKPLDRDHPTTVHDVHATVLHLLGIDHTGLTWRNNGIDRRLTDVHGRVIDGILS